MKFLVWFILAGKLTAVHSFSHGLQAAPAAPASAACSAAVDEAA